MPNLYLELSSSQKMIMVAGGMRFWDDNGGRWQRKKNKKKERKKERKKEGKVLAW